MLSFRSPDVNTINALIILINSYQSPRRLRPYPSDMVIQRADDKRACVGPFVWETRGEDGPESLLERDWREAVDEGLVCHVVERYMSRLIV